MGLLLLAEATGVKPARRLFTPTVRFQVGWARRLCSVLPKNCSVFYRFTVITPLHRFVPHQTVDTNCVADTTRFELVLTFRLVTLSKRLASSTRPSIQKLSSRWDLNPRHPTWQAGILTNWITTTYSWQELPESNRYERTWKPLCYHYTKFLYYGVGRIRTGDLPIDSRDCWPLLTTPNLYERLLKLEGSLADFTKTFFGQ